MRMSIKDRMRYWWTIFYFPFYVITFTIAEKINTEVTIISIPFDHSIPFIEYFIIPYLVWFPFIAITFAMFFWKDKKEFVKYVSALYIGMTVFLAVSFIFPNGLDLRPVSFERENIFVDMVKQLYSTDTSTNVIPSIHAYNSICAAIAIIKSKSVFTGTISKVLCTILSLSIVLSTVFLKQHSILDVIAAIVMYLIVYYFVYGRGTKEKTE